MYIRSEDGYLFCKVSGQGEPLLLLHGNGENHRIFEHQVPFFRRQYKVIEMDTRGHGLSDHGEGVLTFDQIAKDILTVLTYFEFSKVSIVGFSDGGNIALYFARNYTEKVHKAVIIGANVEPSGMRTRDLLTVKVECGLYKAGSLFSNKLKRKKEVIDLMLHQLALDKKDLSHISVPVLVIAGDKDVIKEEHTKTIHQLLPDSYLEIFKNANHFLMVHQPEKLNQKVAVFLKCEKDNQRGRDKVRFSHELLEQSL